MLSLHLLGGLRTCVGEQPLAGRAAHRKRLALLALLAIARSRTPTRDKLVALLWPEYDVERGRHQLATALYDLRKAGGEDLILAAGDDLRLNPTRITCDLWEFEEALSAGEAEQAVQGYAGPLLDGFFLSDAAEFERYVDGERDRHARLYERALNELAATAEARGDFAAATLWWRRLAVQDPYGGPVALGLMRALIAAGNATAAIQHASIHAALVEREFGTAPNPDVMALAEQLRASGVSQLKAVHRSEAVPPVHCEHEDVSGEFSHRESAHADAAAATEESRPTRDADAPERHYLRRRRAGALGLGSLLLMGSLTLLFAGGRPALSAEDAPLETVAVLPLKNDTGDPAQEHFADAMTEALITELAREIELRVISRTSVRRYREPADRNLPQIARELNADVIVEGSVFRDGDQVRITAQLIRASTDEHLWAESYDGSARDIFALQARVARAVAQQIGVKLARRGDSTAGTAARVDPAAYEAYTRGRASAGLRSVAALQEAIRLDPEFAAAYATLADRLAILGFFGFLPPDSAFGAARKAALQALAMNGELAEAHGALGIVLLHHDWNWPGAEKHFRRALVLNPSSAHLRHMFAHQLLALGRNAESARESARAAQLDPFNASLIACSGWHGLAHGQHETAVRESVRALRLEPESFWPEMILGWAYEQEGRYPEAITALRDAVSHSGGSSFALASLAHAHAAAGEARKARYILAELLERTETQYVSAFDIAAVYAGLGERENALHWLERAYGERSSFLINLAWDPRFRSLHGDPRFDELIRKVGLPQRPHRT